MKAHIVMEHLGSESQVHGVYSSKLKADSVIQGVMQSCKANGFWTSSVYSSYYGGRVHTASNATDTYSFWIDTRDIC